MADDGIPIPLDDDDDSQRREQARAIPMDDSPAPAIDTGTTPPADDMKAPPAMTSARAIPVDQSPGSTDDLESKGLALRTAFPRAIAGNQPPAIGSTEQLENQNLANHLSKPQTAIRTGVAGLWDKAENLHNPFLRVLGEIGAGSARALDTIGTIAAPNIAGAIPGSTVNQELKAKKAQADEKENLGEDLTRAQTNEANARAGYTTAQTGEIGQPKPKEEAWKIVPGVVGPGGKVLQEEANSGQVRWVPGIEGAGAVKPPADKPDNPEQQLIDAEQAVAGAQTPEAKQAAQGKLDLLKRTIAENAALTQKPERPQAGSTRSDKSFTYNNDKLDKLSNPVEQIQGRMGRLNDTLAQGTPQADALIAPELLSVMAGGPGSGLRMNEAEINRIVGGRSAWENLHASMQHWATNPEEARSITPDQQKQIHALVQAVNVKLTAKQSAIDAARESLLDSDDPKEHRRILADLHKKLNAIDAGEGGGGAKTLSTAAIEKAAKDHNISVEEAKKQAQAQGYTVQ